MADSPCDPRIVAHIEAISARVESEAERLLSAMLRDCWPGGPVDRTDPEALDWVRRWGPRCAGPIPPACSCAAGRCLVCN